MSVADPTVRSNWYVRSGTWQVKLETFQEAQPDVDIWLSNIDDIRFQPLPGSTAAKEEGLETDASFRRPRDWILYTLRSPACGKDVIVVGTAAVSRTVSTLFSPHRPSSRGPSTDASIQALKWKPHLIAPGVDVRVAEFKEGGHPDGAADVHVQSHQRLEFRHAVRHRNRRIDAGAHHPALKQADILKFVRVNIDPMMSNATVTAWMRKYDVGDPTIIGEGFLNAENAVAAVSDTP